jgi:hypothetical protein
VSRRSLLLVALTLVGLSVVTGVGGVSSVSADRTVSIAVAEDEEALLGVEFGAVAGGTRTLAVSNRISREPLVVTVEDSVASHSRTVRPGETVEFGVRCGDEVRISAVAPSASVDATRSVDCPAGSGADRRSPTERGNEGRCGNSGSNGESGGSGECGQAAARDGGEGQTRASDGDSGIRRNVRRRDERAAGDRRV